MNYVIQLVISSVKNLRFLSKVNTYVFCETTSDMCEVALNVYLKSKCLS